MLYNEAQNFAEGYQEETSWMAEPFQASLVTQGLFRDAKLIVIDTGDHQFPTICPRCGMATEESDRQEYRFRTKGLKAAMFGRASKPCQVCFHAWCVPKFDTVPIWADALWRIFLLMSIGWGIVGFAVPIPAIAGTILLFAVLFFLASIAAWFVLIIDLFVNFHPLRIKKRDSGDEFIWVQGAHRDFVDSLPDV